MPKSDYKIPDEEVVRYKNLVADLPRERSLAIAHMTNNYLKSLCEKKGSYEKMKADMKLKMLKGKEYVHAIGKWDDYLKYLEAELAKER